MNVKVLTPIGLCYGVINAINIAKSARNTYKDKNIYVFGMLIHNEVIIKELEALNIKTIDTTKIINKEEYLRRFSKNDVVIFTAHGTLERYKKILEEKGVAYLDTACHFVNDTHKEILKAINNNKEVIYIGKGSHPETIASLSLSDKNLYLFDLDKDTFDYSKIKSDNPVVLNQTTLSILSIEKIYQEIKQHFKNATLLNEICSTTTIRQQNLINDDSSPDLVLIIGSEKSSNTDKLYAIACNKYKNVLVKKVNYLADVKALNLKDVNNVLVTSGTSAAKHTIDEIITYLKEYK